MIHLQANSLTGSGMIGDENDQYLHIGLVLSDGFVYVLAWREEKNSAFSHSFQWRWTFLEYQQRPHHLKE